MGLNADNTMTECAVALQSREAVTAGCLEKFTNFSCFLLQYKFE